MPRVALLEQRTHLSPVSRPGHGNAVDLALTKLVDASDFVIAVYDTDSRRGDAVDRAMEYLRETGKPYLRIHPDTLELQASPVMR